MILQPNDPAPDFRLPLLAANPTGEAAYWSLSRMLETGPAFLIFAKATCPTCAFAAPLFDRVFRSYPGVAASVVLIAQEGAAGGNRMRAEWGLEVPILLDSEPYPVSDSYGLGFVPSGFFVNQDGIVENVFESFDREETREINRKLARRAAKPAADIFPAEEGVPPFRPG